MADCAFCRIVAGDDAAHVVHADECCMAFLDRRPLFEGHVLVVPRAHHETLSGLPVDLVGPLFATVRAVAAGLEGGFGADGTFVAANNRISQSVPHLHVHVVPRRRKDGLRGFFWPRTRYRDEEHMGQVAAAVATAIRAV